MFSIIETLLNILRCNNCYIAVSIYIVFVLYLFGNFPFCFFSCFSFFDFCFLLLLLGTIFKPYKNTLLIFAGWSFFCEGLIRRYFLLRGNPKIIILCENLWLYLMSVFYWQFSYHLYFLSISKVSSMLHHGSVGLVQSKECYSTL